MRDFVVEKGCLTVGVVCLFAEVLVAEEAEELGNSSGQTKVGLLI